jgi:hypothetical protein
MLLRTLGTGWLMGLALGSVLTCGPVVTDEGKSASVDSARQEKQGKDLEKFLYRLLRQDGCLKYPKMNYELYVKRVQGRKLLETEFKRRDPKTQQIDLVARAREAELHVDMKTRKILVHMRYCHVTSSNPEDGAGWFEDRVWAIDLREFPADLWK